LDASSFYFIYFLTIPSRSQAMRRLPLLLVLCWASSAVYAEPCLYHVGTRSQLFIDSFLVRDAVDVSYTLHPGKKHAANPLLKADQPWEGWGLQLYGSVLFDREEKRFKMWYTVTPSPYFDREVTCYAVSADGIRWEKPLVGTLKAKIDKPHGAVADCLLASVFKDSADPNPARRYKMVCFVYDRGYVTKVSPDGLKWTDESKGPLARIWYGEDVVTAFHDPRRGQYVVLCKMTTPIRGRGRRCTYLTASRDFVHWSKPELVFAPDVRDDHGSLPRLEEVRPLLHHPDNPNVMRAEFYGSGAHVAEDCVVALPWLFTANANIPRFGNQDGISEVQLAVSRDLETWARPFRTPVLRRGKADQWDCGFFSTASQTVTVADEVRLYYGCANFGHGAPLDDPQEAGQLGKKYRSSIGLASWPRDRFVSADGPAEGGILTTIPITFTGKRLELNAATKVGGALLVELLDTGGRPLAGFASDPIQGDDLRHTVRFARGNLEKWAGKPVSLRFSLKRAALFSFAFRD
jgi:hypothetical protein